MYAMRSRTVPDLESQKEHRTAAAPIREGWVYRYRDELFASVHRVLVLYVCICISPIRSTGTRHGPRALTQILLQADRTSCTGACVQCIALRARYGGVSRRLSAPLLHACIASNTGTLIDSVPSRATSTAARLLAMT